MVTAIAAQDLGLHHGTVAADGDACSSSEGHGCCKKKAQATRNAPAVNTSGQRVKTRTDDSQSVAHHTSRASLAESSTSGMKSCPFAVARALAVAKIHDGQMNATAAVSHVMAGTLVREQTLPLSTLSPMPNRGHTYLRCCAFLI
jgi:hypothetical protein